MKDLEHLRDALRVFAGEREWDRYHSPKNLAMALCVEAAELLEQFQWLTEAESAEPDVQCRAAVEEELADVLIYLVRLADRLGVDLIAAASAKLEANEKKYPVRHARGNARKYTTFSDEGGSEE
jgi:dCTP diphosphatase